MPSAISWIVPAVARGVLIAGLVAGCGGGGGDQPGPTTPVPVANRISITTPAAGAASGAPFTTQPVVAIQNVAGNTVTSATNVVTMTVSAGATVLGTATATASIGVATFSNVGLSGKAGTTYTLTFATGSLASATQAITPTVGAATQLVLTTHAAGAANGAALGRGLAFVTQPMVQIQDVAGNVVTTAKHVVTMAVSMGGTVVGTAIVTAIGGTATFTNVGISGTPGTNYTLTFSATSLTAATQSLVTEQFVASSLTAGASHTCGPTSAGAAYCWGANTYGQLGNNSTTPGNTPVAVTGIGGGVALVFSSLTGGDLHTCGLRSAGAAYCWGWNLEGQLGDNSTALRNTPVAVTGVGGGAALVFSSLTAGASHTCGLTSAGAAYCWGWNLEGQLGDNSTTNRKTPVAVAGVGGGAALLFSSLTAGRSYTCGLTMAGAAYCWGQNTEGQLGDNSTTNRKTPVAVTGVGGGAALVFSSLTTGGYHTCGLTSAGAAYCWGTNQYGQLGDNTAKLVFFHESATGRRTPVAVTGVGGGAALVFSSLTGGDLHTCGLTNAGAAYWWGRNTDGQLGDNTTTDRGAPVAVLGVSGGAALVFSSLTGGDLHTCGLTSAGAVYCWGWNADGQLGDNTTTNRRTPVAVAKP